MRMPALAAAPIVVASAMALILAACSGEETGDAPSPSVDSAGSHRVAATPSPSSPVTGGPAGSPSGPGPAETTVEPTAPPTAGDGDDGGGDGAVVIEIVETDHALGVFRVQAVIYGVDVDEGECLATMTGDIATFSITTPASFNVDRTECAAIEFPVGDLEGDTWRLDVAFDDGNHTVSPDTREVEIP